MKTFLNALRSSSYSTPSTSTASSTSISPLCGRPTHVPKDPTAIRAIITPTLLEQCTCDIHSAAHYFDYPLSCHSEHLPSDLTIHPHRRPLLNEPDAHNHPYNALFLARATVKWFAREEEIMDAPQRGGLIVFRNMVKEGLMERLNAADCRKTLDEEYMGGVVRSLCDVFFFGEDLLGRGFKWSRSKETEWECGEKTPLIRIHPISYDEAVYTSRACQRLGAIMHDLIRVFLSQHACPDCKWAWKENVNIRGRGRAWQVMAKGIEEAGPKLLGVRDIGLRRLACLVADVEDEVEKVSRHDLEVYGYSKLLDVDEVETEGGLDDEGWVMVDGIAPSP
ncbi:hypothetical protein P280DRAFT_79827 [Massarina eburnea CBS 473.64]|uniref:Uncharacterized protein n=1 Tax=Massarina eburnea CBS 473.64 TaxID=1395130 RepID=A0A6A6RVM5_9PLEO|nr:hypothetical protein P280DRAFT_79827 [Massarina eburnea CBS 473.64]